MATIKSEDQEKIALATTDAEGQPTTIDIVRTTMVLEETQQFNQTKEQLKAQKTSLTAKLKKIDAALALLK